MDDERALVAVEFNNVVYFQAIGSSPSMPANLLALHDLTNTVHTRRQALRVIGQFCRSNRC